MTVKTYSIFGAGASGLYTAWRLLSGKTRGSKFKDKQLRKGDVLELYDWGKYDFSKAHPGTRAPGARVCTWHYKDDETQSFLELGGMRYVQWDASAPDANGGEATGHRVVSTVISELGLDKYAVPFNISSNPLYYLRARNIYSNSITSANPAAYDVSNYGETTSPDGGFGTIEQVAFPTSALVPKTRTEWDDFYQNGRINIDMPDASIYQKGDYFSDIGYWNLMYDQLGGEGFNYVADGNGYTSNVINWNAADAIQANNEFTPGSQYNTLTIGYSGMFTALFDAIVRLAKEKGVQFRYYPDTRLHSILAKGETIHYTYATREKPWSSSGSRTTDAAWLAMAPYALDLVAQATRYADNDGLDVLNAEKVQLYMGAVIQQPSYKVGMFFDSEWWLKANFPPQIIAYVVTDKVLAQLKKEGFPAAWLKSLRQSTAIYNQSVEGTANFVSQAEQAIGERLSLDRENQLTAAAQRNSIGPSVTDTPIRQVVYFGNNARDRKGTPVYGILASYDDEQYTSFWRELELGAEEERRVPIQNDTQPLQGPRVVPPEMVKMLRRQLAEVHFGPSFDYSSVPEPLESRYMDWSLPPFNAGYHAWAAHFDIAEVQQGIRKPSQLIAGADANIFIVGEAYSNDQAWVEGAYCTAESVLNDFFGIEPIIDDTNYPFICKIARRR
jgi:hypothetical protein